MDREKVFTSNTIERKGNGGSAGKQIVKMHEEQERRRKSEKETQTKRVCMVVGGEIKNGEISAACPIGVGGGCQEINVESLQTNRYAHTHSAAHTLAPL